MSSEGGHIYEAMWVGDFECCGDPSLGDLGVLLGLGLG